MTSPNTYDLLVQAVIDISEDDSSEFSSFIPTAINMAEDRLFRELNINYSVVTNSVTCTPGNQLVNKPSDLRVTTGLFVIVANETIPLIKRGDEFCSDYWPNAAITSVPKYYADRDIAQWRVVPTPNASYNLQAQYEAKPAYLSSSNQSNVYTERYADMIFYASMVNMCEFMKDTERKGEWDQRLQEAIQTVNNEGLLNSTEDNPNKVIK